MHLVKLLQQDDWAPLLRGAGAVQVVEVSLAANIGGIRCGEGWLIQKIIVRIYLDMQFFDFFV